MNPHVANSLWCLLGMVCAAAVPALVGLSYRMRLRRYRRDLARWQREWGGENPLSDFSLDIASIPAALRPAADMLTDRAREITDLLDAGRTDATWAGPRLRSIALTLDLMRQPQAVLFVRATADEWPTVAPVRGVAAE